MSDRLPKVRAIAWCGASPPEAPPPESPKDDPSFDIITTKLSDLGAQRADVVVLDRVGFDSIDSLKRAYGAVSTPTLLISPKGDLDELCGFVRNTDLVATKDAGWAFISHCLRHLLEVGRFPRDELTGLCSRRSFIGRLEELLPGASTADPLSLIVVDIDHFKAINDSHGHAIGDLVLKRLATVLETRATAAELVARYGGEEFGLLLLAGEEGAMALAEDLRAEASSTPYVEDIDLTVSLGLSTTTGEIDAPRLLREADEALYAAKAAGRDCVRSYTALQKTALEQDEDIAMASFENMTRVVSERIVNVITRRSRRLFAELKQQADVDVLTQLYSRRALERRLEHDFDSSRELSLPLTVALVDIDHFGQINKTHGWPSGDKVLAEVADVIRSMVRTTDWIGRYGGEEFCLGMPGTSLEQSANVLERIRSGVENHRFSSTAGDAIELTVSIGAAGLGEKTGRLEELVEEASDRLLAAKNGGRNKIEVEA